MPDITPKKGTERAMIDCNMIVVTTKEETPRCIAVTSGTKLGVEPVMETTDAVKCIIKGVLKAQKKEINTITGHTLTLTDNLTILELIEILQGGTLVKDDSGNITGYTPPVAGDEYNPTPFTLDAYSAQLDTGGNVVKYEKISYPGCTGSPVGLGSEDNVFRVTEYTINSAPASGEPPYTLEYVDSLPTPVQAVLEPLTVNSAEGTSSGKTKITVTPAKESGNAYKYKAAASVTLPVVDSVISTGYTDWDGTSEITATSGQKILVVEVDGESKAKKAGIATIAAKA